MTDFRFVITGRIKAKMMQSRTTFDTRLKNPLMQEFLPFVSLEPLAHYSLAFKPVTPFFSFVLLAHYSLVFQPAGL